MIVFPFGAVTAASNMIRKNSKQPKAEKKPASRITITIDDENVQTSFEVINDFDWARAAWALTRICEQRGQAESLARLLKEEHI